MTLSKLMKRRGILVQNHVRIIVADTATAEAVSAYEGRVVICPQCSSRLLPSSISSFFPIGFYSVFRYESLLGFSR
jgi:hypothetical protein